MPTVPGADRVAAAIRRKHAEIDLFTGSAQRRLTYDARYTATRDSRIGRCWRRCSSPGPRSVMYIVSTAWPS